MRWQLSRRGQLSQRGSLSAIKRRTIECTFSSDRVQFQGLLHNSTEAAVTTKNCPIHTRASIQESSHPSTWYRNWADHLTEAQRQHWGGRRRTQNWGRNGRATCQPTIAWEPTATSPKTYETVLHPWQFQPVIMHCLSTWGRRQLLHIPTNTQCIDTLQRHTYRGSKLAY